MIFNSLQTHNIHNLFNQAWFHLQRLLADRRTKIALKWIALREKWKKICATRVALHNTLKNDFWSTWTGSHPRRRLMRGKIGGPYVSLETGRAKSKTDFIHKIVNHVNFRIDVVNIIDFLDIGMLYFFNRNDLCKFLNCRWWFIISDVRNY